MPLVTRARSFFRRHWQGALHWRERIVFKEEAFHLLLAALIGVIGGSVNLFFFYAGEMVQRLFLPQPIDPVQVQKILTTRKSGLLDKFISKAGKPFPAYLVMDEKGKVTFDFPPREGEV